MDTKKLPDTETARQTVIDSIVNFTRTNTTEAMMQIVLCANDAEAKARGWDSAASHRRAVIEIVQALPVDLRNRVRVRAAT